MQYRIDNKSGNELSILGFGCMRFPLDARKTEKLILSAISGGVNYFDTAYIYANSETVLGEILDKNKVREKIYVATKLPFQKCKKYEDFDRLFNTQLERLKTGYIDYYLIHNMSDLMLWGSLCDIGLEKWLDGKKASGQIRRVGFSFHGALNEFISLLEVYDWDFCQIQYNYMDENYQAGRAGLQKAHEKGLPVIVMEPLLGGKLANGLPAKAARLFNEANGNRSAASWGLCWLWNQPEVTVVLSGMNSEKQLEDNIITAKTAEPGMLSETENAVFRPVVDITREAYKIPCTECNYCMPCPQGVNIPGCFAAYNTSYAIGFGAGLTQYVTGTGANNPKKHYNRRRCVKCGACEEKCPQHIEIIQCLDTVTKRMEPFWFGPYSRFLTKIVG